MVFDLANVHPRALLARIKARPRPTPVDLLHHAVALVASLAFGLGYGLNYGVSNQTAYMLGALKMLDSSVLADDWYASHTANYHPAFSFVGWFLLLFSRRGVGVAVGQVLAIAWGALGVYALCRALWRPLAKLLGAESWARTYALATFLIMTAIMTRSGTGSIAVSYIFDNILQPSTLGGLFFTLSIAPFVEGRWLKSGIYFALAGLFHANYLLLGIASFGAAHLALGTKGLVQRGLSQLAPAAVPLLILAPMILASASSPDAARAHEILFAIRSPHHYNPRGFERAFYPFAGWQMLGFGLGGFILRRAGDAGKRLGALILGLALVVWIGTFLTTVVYIPKVAQLFVFRFAPFLELLSQLLLVLTAVHLLVRPSLARQVSFTGWTIALIGGVLVAMTKLKRDAPLPLGTGAAVGLGLGIACWLALRASVPLVPRLRAFELRARQVALGLVTVLGLGVAALVTLPRAMAYRQHSNIYNADKGPENELYAWIRAKTPKNAIFLSPPQMERFRLGAERGIVVDWKGSTYLPSELVAWYVRLEDVSGRKGFRREADLVNGYASLDDSRIQTLRQRYGFDYVVVAAGKEKSLKSGKTIFRNSRFAVVKLE
jgi:hypothetical protein